MAKNESKAASMQKTLPVRHPGESPETPEEQEKREFDRSEQHFKAKMDEIRAKDKIGEVLDYAPFATNQTPAQIWGFKLKEEDCASPIRFCRWYFGNGVVVDFFRTQKEYDAANVEVRRALVHKYGGRYAALGPRHSRYPLPDPKMRAKYPSMTEQLEQKGKGKGK